VLPPPLLGWTGREATAAHPPQLQTSKQTTEEKTETS